MTYFTQELHSILIFVVASLVLSLVLFLAVYIMSFTSKVEFEKSSAYECGFAPFSETNFPFEVQFALIAIMFLLFDIEVLYLYPLITSILDFTFHDMITFTIFFLILTVGIVFEVSRQVMSMNIISEVKNRGTNSQGLTSIMFITGFNDWNLILSLVLIMSFFLYFYKHPKSSLLLCPTEPFHVVNPTKEEINIVLDATRFIRNRLNEGMDWVTIREEAYKLYEWVIYTRDIGAIKNMMIESGTYNPPAIPGAFTNIVTDTVLNTALETFVNSPVDNTIVNTTVETVANTTAETVVNTTVEIVANASSFQQTWWFPIVVIGTVTILFLGLAEIRNRVYPQTENTVDAIISDESLYSVYEPGYFSNFPFIWFGLCITMFYITHRLINVIIVSSFFVVTIKNQPTNLPILNNILIMTKTLIMKFNKLKDLIIYNFTFHIRNSVVSKHNPITILLALGPDASKVEKEAAKQFALQIIGYIKDGYSESQIINYMSNQLEINVSPEEILYAIGCGLDSKILSMADLCKDFYINPLYNIGLPSGSSSSAPSSSSASLTEAPSSSSSSPSPSPSSSSPSPSPSSSSPSPSPSSSLPEAPDKSILSSIGTYVNEHKLLIIGSIAVAVVVGTVIYIHWKRRGPTPPTGQESIPSSESDQTSTPSTSAVIAKIVYIVIGLTVVFALYYPLINNNISYVL